MRLRILLSVAVAMLLAISCLNRTEPFGDPPLFDTFLLVDTGYTPSDTSWLIGEYSSFTLHWNASGEADYYIIKYYPVPVTLDNWDDILVSVTVPGTVDSTNVFVQPSVFQNVCISCGLCVEACPHDAITLQGDGRAVIDLNLCTSCGECVRACPVNAIEDSNFDQAYYFGVRAYSSTDMPSSVIAASTISYKIIYYNDDLWCGKCTGNLPGGGTWSGCFIINTNTKPDGSGSPTGPGCPVDAIWQDTASDYMVYIDYDKCINCGICFDECWNYLGRVDPDFGYNGLFSLRKRVVPGWFVPDVPEPPAR
jgi:ferredoxin